MTQIRTTTPNPHTKPTVAAIIGVVIGVLTAAEGFFHTGHLPSGVEVASILAGAGLSLGSLGAGVAAHFGITKAEIAHDAQLVQAEWVKAEPLLSTVENAVPGLQTHLDTLEASVDKRIHDLVASLPGVDVDKLAEAVRQRLLGTPVAPAAPAASASTTPAAPAQ